MNDARSNQPRPSKLDHASVEAMLRREAARAAAGTARDDGQLRGKVLRRIQAGDSAQSIRRTTPGGSWWWIGGAMASAVAAVITIAFMMQPSVTATSGPSVNPLPPRVELPAKPRLDRSAIARAADVDRPLEIEAQRLRSDIERGVSFLRSKVSIARRNG